jgi:predicted flap endonuclease-1-like 5' DNA nuclease
MVLKKLKSLLGFDDSESDADRQRDIGVTVEREPDEAPDTSSEDAVKGTDDETGTADASAGSETATPSEPADDEPTTEPADAVEEADEPADEEPAAADEAASEPSTEAEPETETEEEPVADEADDSADEASTEAETETEDEAAGEPTDEIKGIGPAYAERLSDAGIDTVDELAEADAESLATETDLSEKRLSEWIQRAQVR